MKKLQVNKICEVHPIDLPHQDQRQVLHVGLICESPAFHHKTGVDCDLLVCFGGVLCDRSTFRRLENTRFYAPVRLVEYITLVAYLVSKTEFI